MFRLLSSTVILTEKSTLADAFDGSMGLQDVTNLQLPFLFLSAVTAWKDSFTTV